MSRWRGRRWSDYEYVPRPKLRTMSDVRRVEALEQLTQGLQDSPVLTALGWTVHGRRGRYYFEDNGGEVVGRVTPIGRNKFLLEVEGRTAWREELTHTSPAEIVAHVAADEEGTFHGLGALDTSLREHGVERLEMCAVDTPAPEWWYLDLPPGRGAATVVEVLYHAFGIPIPVATEPRGWWEYHRTPVIIEHQPDAVFVNFGQTSMYGTRFSGRCLYVKRGEKWGAYTIKPNQADTIETSLAWLRKGKWRSW